MSSFPVCDNGACVSKSRICWRIGCMLATPACRTTSVAQGHNLYHRPFGKSCDMQAFFQMGITITSSKSHCNHRCTMRAISIDSDTRSPHASSTAVTAFLRFNCSRIDSARTNTPRPVDLTLAIKYPSIQGLHINLLSSAKIHVNPNQSIPMPCIFWTNRF